MVDKSDSLVTLLLTANGGAVAEIFGRYRTFLSSVPIGPSVPIHEPSFEFSSRDLAERSRENSGGT